MSIKLLVFGVISIFCIQFVHADYCYNDVVGACSPVGKLQFFLYYSICLFYVYLIIYRRRYSKL